MGSSATSDVLTSNPLLAVDQMYAAFNSAGGGGGGKTSAKDLKRFIDAVSTRFRSASTSTSTPPSLNALKRDELRDGMLVRFRGMVQDMFESEIYLADFPSREEAGAASAALASAEASRRVCGLFRDAAPNEVIGLDPLNGDCALLDRQSLYCVPVPGETFWVKEFDADVRAGEKAEEESMQTEPTTAQNLKRPCEEDMNGSGEAKDDSSPKKAKVEGGEESKPNSSSSSSASKQFQLNFPLADEKGPAVIVKIYDPNSDLKVCDVCDFVGVLSLDQPQAAASSSFPPSASTEATMDLSEMETETLLQSPPTSLVPRLHVIFKRKIRLNNPHLDDAVRIDDDNNNNNEENAVDGGADAAKVSRDSSVAKELAELKEAKGELTALLKTLLMGDALAAEYFLCHLVSSVHSRRDLRPIGKMTLNLSNCPSGLPLGKRIAQVLQLLCPAVDRLPMSLPVLNGPPFVPVKDYEANRVLSSRLQLAKGTEVVLDETVLSPGQLNEKGVRNLTILGTLIQWQKLDYDFKWTAQEFPTDLRLIVVSEGKSILPSDFQLHLNAAEVDADLFDANMNNILSTLSPSAVARLRRFLSLAQTCPYHVEAETQRMIEEDFVAARAQNERNMTVEDFERLLLLSRYVTLTETPSNGGSLTVDTWRRCKRMEEERKSRIPPARATAAAASNGDPVRVGVEQ